MAIAPPPQPPANSGQSQPAPARWQWLLGLSIQWLAGGYLLYRLKSIVGINLAAHHHAIDLLWHPLDVLRDLIHTQLGQLG